MAIVIPTGKLVQIRTIADVKGNFETTLASLADTPLVLEEDVTLNINTKYAPVVGVSTNVGLKVFSQLTRELTGFQVGTDFKELGFQLWESTEPLSVSITVGLYMKTNAQTEVWQPAKELMKIALPEELKGSAGFGLKAPGPTVLQALGINKQSKDLLVIRIGNMKLYPAVITRVEPTISKETDQFNNPIWVKLRLDIQTIFTATTNLIDEWS